MIRGDTNLHMNLLVSEFPNRSKSINELNLGHIGHCTDNIYDSYWTLYKRSMKALALGVSRII
jgi:hypothetical protein